MLEKLFELPANQRRLAWMSTQKAIELASLQDETQFESNLRLILDEMTSKLISKLISFMSQF